MGQSLALLAFVLLGTWWLFSGKPVGKSERELIDAALRGDGKDDAVAGGGGGDARDFVAAMQNAVSLREISRGECGNVVRSPFVPRSRAVGGSWEHRGIH